MSKELPKAGNFYASAPYKDAFDIAYPQENREGEMDKYRGKCSKRPATAGNGQLENHAVDCTYRQQRQHGG